MYAWRLEVFFPVAWRLEVSSSFGYIFWPFPSPCQQARWGSRSGPSSRRSQDRERRYLYATRDRWIGNTASRPPHFAPGSTDANAGGRKVSGCEISVPFSSTGRKESARKGWARGGRAGGGWLVKRVFCFVSFFFVLNHTSTSFSTVEYQQPGSVLAYLVQGGG